MLWDKQNSMHYIIWEKFRYNKLESVVLVLTSNYTVVEMGETNKIKEKCLFGSS